MRSEKSLETNSSRARESDFVLRRPCLPGIRISDEPRVAALHEFGSVHPRIRGRQPPRGKRCVRNSNREAAALGFLPATVEARRVIHYLDHKGSRPTPHSVARARPRDSIPSSSPSPSLLSSPHSDIRRSSTFTFTNSRAPSVVVVYRKQQGNFSPHERPGKIQSSRFERGSESRALVQQDTFLFFRSIFRHLNPFWFPREKTRAMTRKKEARKHEKKHLRFLLSTLLLPRNDMLC